MKTAEISAHYIDHLGSDLLVANAARTSFGKESSWDWDGIDRPLAVLPPFGTYNGAGHLQVLKPADANLIRFLASGYRASEWDALLDEVIAIAKQGDPASARAALAPMLGGYKNKAQHWAPFAHPQLSLRMKLPLFLARQFVKHCVTGDTEITFVKRVKGESNGTRKATIESLYNMWTGQANKYQGGGKGRRNVSCGHVRVFDEEKSRFSTSHISDVIYQGVKPVYRVITEFGQSLRATGNHEVMTQRGWVRVDSLRTTDSMITEVGLGDLVSPAPLRWNDWPDKKARRGVIKDFCAKCGTSEDLEADHIISVASGGGHDPENMQCLCTPCHKEKSATEKSAEAKNQYDPRFVKVVSIDPAGEERVYDVTVEGVHNFMANGLVAHNCVGATWSEESRRYMSSEPEFWFPVNWHKRPEDIKQGACGLVEDQAAATEVSQSVTQIALDAYNTMLGQGVAPEEARTCLTLNAMTTVTWTGSLLFWSRVANQRLDGHAQLAAQALAREIAEIVAPRFPVSWAALVG